MLHAKVPSTHDDRNSYCVLGVPHSMPPVNEGEQVLRPDLPDLPCQAVQGLVVAVRIGSHGYH